MRKKVFSVLLLSLPFIMLIINYNCRVSRVPTEYPTDTLYTNIDGKGDLLKIDFLGR